MRNKYKTSAAIAQALEKGSYTINKQPPRRLECAVCVFFFWVFVFITVRKWRRSSAGTHAALVNVGEGIKITPGFHLLRLSGEEMVAVLWIFYHYLPSPVKKEEKKHFPALIRVELFIFYPLTSFFLLGLHRPPPTTSEGIFFLRLYYYYVPRAVRPRYYYNVVPECCSAPHSRYRTSIDGPKMFMMRFRCYACFQKQWQQGDVLCPSPALQRRVTHITEF